MKIAIDVSPITGEMTGHKVRGVGFYLEYLKRSLETYYPKNHYIFFTDIKTVPSDIDVLHYPYFDPFYQTLPAKSPFKTVVTVHDLTPILFPSHFPAGLKGKIRWEFQKHALKKQARIITDSMASKKDIISITGINEKQVDVAYLAASEDFKQLEKGTWRRDIREKYHIPEKFVLYVGDVTWNKNVPRLVKAIQELNVHLVLVGKTLPDTSVDVNHPWNADLLQLRQMTKNDERIHRLGFVKTPDLVSLYNLATVFAFPSVYEGFGLPVLEAMQCGCPVVTTKGGSLLEVAGDAAIFVDGYTVESIKEGISDVYVNHHVQEDLIQKGLMQASKFSWEKTADVTIESYKKALL